MKKEDKEKLKVMLDEFGKETDIKIPSNMLEDEMRIEQEAKYFNDYLDARFQSLKMPEVYRLPLYMLIVEEMMAIMFRDMDDSTANEMAKDLVEGAMFERQRLKELSMQNQK